MGTLVETNQRRPDFMGMRIGIWSNSSKQLANSAALLAVPRAAPSSDNAEIL